VRTLERAKATLERQCLRNYGFDVPIPEPPGPPSLAYDRYGLWDQAHAQTHGYRPAPVNDSGRIYGEVLPAEAQAVYTGRKPAANAGPGGCQGEAMRALGGEQPPAKDPLDLADDALELSKRDDRVRDLFKAWSSCLSRAGWRNLRRPDDAVSHWLSRPPPNPAAKNAGPPEREVAMAVADVQCKKQTNILGTWLAADLAYQQQIVDQNGDELRRWRQWIDRRLDIANRVLSQAR
jgi:hypothetical protein